MNMMMSSYTRNIDSLDEVSWTSLIELKQSSVIQHGETMPSQQACKYSLHCDFMPQDQCLIVQVKHMDAVLQPALESYDESPLSCAVFVIPWSNSQQHQRQCKRHRGLSLIFQASPNW